MNARSETAWDLTTRCPSAQRSRPGLLQAARKAGACLIGRLGGASPESRSSDRQTGSLAHQPGSTRDELARTRTEAGLKPYLDQILLCTFKEYL